MKATAKTPSKPKRPKAKPPVLNRQHFETSRTLDFFSVKELVGQTGHQVHEWPLVCLKEMLDNSLDACEESGIAPSIRITVDAEGITLTDNGPGIPPYVMEGVLDFGIRVSSREAYASPCRGAQGNALKTLVAMPFALSGFGIVIVEAMGLRHEIETSVDQIRQEPRIEHRKTHSDLKIGTKITIPWANKASFIAEAKSRFLQMAGDYCWLNPHLSLSVNWRFGDEEQHETLEIPASNPQWIKWLPSNPTDPHWYDPADFERLIVAHIRRGDPTPLVRDLVAEFRGLTGSAKQKRITAPLGLTGTRLSELVRDDAIDREQVGKLLDAMKQETNPVKPESLGVIGKEHLAQCCERAGGEPGWFKYKKISGVEGGIPWIIESCFSYCPEEIEPRRIIAGVNWSPGIINPFRQLGKRGHSLDSIFQDQRVGTEEPVVVVIHMTSPRVRYADRGKTSVNLER